MGVGDWLDRQNAKLVKRRDDLVKNNYISKNDTVNE